MANNDLLVKIHKDLSRQLDLVKSGGIYKNFVLTYKLDTRNYNEKKGDFYYFIKDKLNELMKKFEDNMFWGSYKENYIFSNSKDLINKRTLELVDNEIEEEYRAAIKDSMGDFGLKFYIEFLEWYKENGQFDLMEYRYAFSRKEYNNLYDVLDEITLQTKYNSNISNEERDSLLQSVEKYKYELDEYVKEQEEECI